MAQEILIPTEISVNYSNAEKEIKALERKLDSATRNRQILIETQMVVANKMQDVKAQLDEAKKKATSSPAEAIKQQSVIASLQQEYDALQAKVDAYERRIESATEKVEGLESALRNASSASVTPEGESMSMWQNAVQMMKDTLANLPQIAGLAFGKVGELAVKAGQGVVALTGKILELGRKGLSALGNLARKGFSALGSAIKGAITNLSALLKSSNKSVSGFKRMSTAFFTGMIGARSAMYLFRMAGRAVKDGIKDIAKSYPELNKSLESAKASLNQLKVSASSAFAPLLINAIPVFNAIIAKITEAINALGRFFALLAGNTAYQKAIANNKALEKSAGGAKKATDSMTASIDELNIISDNSGGGGDSSVASMETEQLGPNAFVDKLKGAWEAGDFTEIGKIIGTKLKEALENIPWAGIREKCQKIATSIGTFINGFVKTTGLGTTLGKTLGEAINTAFTTLLTFLHSVDWSSVGAFIGNALNGMVDTVDFSAIGLYFAEKMNAISDVIGASARTFDWTQLGDGLAYSINSWITGFDWKGSAENLSSLAKGLLDTLIATFEGINWQELGENVKTFIANIDWSGLAERIAEGIGAGLGGLTAFLVGLLGEAWQSVVDWWHEVAFEDGKFTIQGLLDGIWEVFKTIGNWINEHLLQPFKKGFERAFQIGSPSKLMKQEGNFIMQGMLNGVIEFIQPLIDKFNEIKDKVVGVMTNLKEGVVQIFTDMWGGMKTVINAILGGIETMANGIIRGINSAIEAINSLAIDIPDWVPVVGGESLHFSIPTLREISIPRLAEGAVIPPNNKFLAMLGDQTSGTNIEAPVAVIQDALRDVIGDSNDRVVTVLEALLRVVETKDTVVRITDRDIGVANARYTSSRGQYVNRGAFANAR